MAIRKFVILVAGHSPQDPGALGQGSTEAHETIQITDRVHRMLIPHPNIYVEVVPHSLDFVASTNWINARYKNLDDGVIVEIHKNSTVGATGIETFTGIGPDNWTMKLATDINNNLVAKSGLRNRGVKHSPFYLITNTNQRAVLVEAGFMQADPIDDAADARYALGIAKGVAAFFGEPLTVTPPAPKLPVSKRVPNAVKLPTPILFRVKPDTAQVWDLETNPDYRSTKTLKRGEDYRAFAYIEFNGTRYYQTQYSFGKNKTGINAIDVEVIPPIVKPSPDPTPTPVPPVIKPEPPKENPKEDIIVAFTAKDQAVLQAQAQGVIDSGNFAPVISDHIKTVAYFVTDSLAVLATLVLTVLGILGVMDAILALTLNGAIVAALIGFKQIFRISSKK